MIKFQIGKSGVTQGVLQSLALAFKNNKIVRISVLKNSKRDKEKVREMADYLAANLEGNYVYTIVGFTIILRRKAALQKSAQKAKK